MRKLWLFPIVALLCAAPACSPKDFLTRRLAADLIAGSDTFKTPQEFAHADGSGFCERLFFAGVSRAAASRLDCRGHRALRAQGAGASGRTSCVLGCVRSRQLGVEAFRALLPNNTTPPHSLSGCPSRSAA